MKSYFGFYHLFELVSSYIYPPSLSLSFFHMIYIFPATKQNNQLILTIHLLHYVYAQHNSHLLIYALLFHSHWVAYALNGMAIHLAHNVLYGFFLLVLDAKSVSLDAKSNRISLALQQVNFKVTHFISSKFLSTILVFPPTHQPTKCEQLGLKTENKNQRLVHTK